MISRGNIRRVTHSAAHAGTTVRAQCQEYPRWDRYILAVAKELDYVR
jgi:hypothetical protein